MDNAPSIEADEFEDFCQVCKAEGFDPKMFTLRARSRYPDAGVGPIERQISIEWEQGGQIEHELFDAGHGSTWLATFGHMLRSGRVATA